jgi:predicted nucleotidyltransferase
MNVTGFSDALESSIHVQIDTALVIPVVSLPGLIILKLFAWLDRKHERRDAPDILKIVSEYADAGNEERLYTDEIQFLEAADFDVTAAGARLLGKDARRISSAETAASLMNVLADASLKQELVNQMIQSGNRTDEFFADHCTLLLDNFERGFTKTMPQQPAGH